MVLIKESQLIRIISEAIGSEIRRKPVLTESQESESIKGATRLYMERTGRSKEEADKFVRIDLRASFPPLRDKKIGKFILGVTRMYLDEQLGDATTVANLNTTLKYVGDPTHINEYDRNLNGLSAQDLIERFAPARKQDMEKDKAELGKAQYTAKNEYKVVRIDSFEQAEQYGKYNDWCLAQPNGKNMYDSYTSEGVNQLYIILRDGFEKEPRVAGSNTPYDSYGLSMMTVIVDPYGQMTQSTTRWNHANGSNDSAFTPKQMSEIIGRNFYEVFKANTKLRDAVEDALERLRNGEDANDMLDSVGKEQEGMRLVKLMGKCNYLTKDNQFLMVQWVDNAWNFCEGFGCVYVIGKNYNFVNAKGESISKTWFNNVRDFHKGFATIEVKGKGWNFINTKGEIMSKIWFDDTYDFYNGFAIVKSDGKYNFINTKGELISEIWFDYVLPFSEGFAEVKLNKKWNFINTKEEYLSNIWFDYVSNFQEGFAIVKSDGKYNFINTKGEYLSNIWFDKAYDFYDGFGCVEKGEKCYFIDEKGNLYDYDDFQTEKKTPVSLNDSTEDSLLLEVATSIEPIRNKYASGLTEDDFYRLMSTDPTFNREGDKMGKYWRWILTMYKRGQINPADERSLSDVKECLTMYTKFINRIELKNIEQIRSVDELKSIIQPFMENPSQATSKTQAIRDIKIKDAIKAYEDDTWYVIIPATMDAAIYYGKNTKWCTSAVKSANKFDEYNDLGNLYIFINRKTGHKYQYFLTRHELKDETNTDVKRIPELTPEAKKFFYNIPAMEESFTEQKDEMVMDKIMKILSPQGKAIFNKLDSISYSDTGLFPIMKVDDLGREMKNFMDRDGHILSKVWFTEVTPFARGKKYSIVSRGLKQNILFPDGKFALNTWSDGLVDPSDFQTQITDDPIIVYFNGRKNVLNKEDWDLGPYWFNRISEFGPDGTADASFDGHKVKIDKKGEVIS